MSKRTPLYGAHVDSGAKIVDFGGWDMPLHYGSQIDEHHAVRRHAGVFDVSHMTVVDISGPASRAYLERLLANDVGKLNDDGRGLYTCMLNPDGGVIDDLIAYRRGDQAYRLVVNAATRDNDLAWLANVAQSFDVTIDERAELAMLALQGPAACEVCAPLIPDVLRNAALALKPFRCTEHGDWFVARTGYTGEDGWEIVLGADDAAALWRKALAVGVAPCGLGARDTLRLEAGLALYGQDMDEHVSPLAAGLAWTVAFDPAERDFIGRAALAAQRRSGDHEKLVGLVLMDRGIMRHGQRVITEAGEGLVTSGGFSPTMERSIALARVPAAISSSCDVEIRGARRRARVVKPPFVRNGTVLIEEL